MDPITPDDIKRWHKILAEVVGDLSLTLEKRSMTMRQVMEWKAKVTAVQTELAAHGIEKKPAAKPATQRKKRR